MEELDTFTVNANQPGHEEALVGTIWNIDRRLENGAISISNHFSQLPENLALYLQVTIFPAMGTGHHTFFDENYPKMTPTTMWKECERIA